MRALPWCLLLVAACGGKLDDGTDSGVDSGLDSAKPDSHADVQVDSPTPPPTCIANGSPCSTAGQCCSQVCDPMAKICVPYPPPPPPCNPDGAPCGGASQCCSNVCTSGTCGPGVGCATSSTKKCDICVAQSCCQPMITCGNDAKCTQWLSCVQNCEQQNLSAMACTQQKCGMPSTVTEQALFNCAQQNCNAQCTVD